MGRGRDDGDDGAGYAAVYAAHRAYVTGLAYLLLGDAHQAEDVAADAFAKVYPRWRRGDVHDARAYLRRAVANEARSKLRRRYLERAVAARRTGDGRGSRSHDEVAADRSDLWHALAQLPPAQRTVLVLRYFEDLPEREIAEVLGCSLGTVKSRAARGLARLEALVDRPGAARRGDARAVGRRPAQEVPSGTGDPSTAVVDGGETAR